MTAEEKRGRSAAASVLESSFSAFAALTRSSVFNSLILKIRLTMTGFMPSASLGPPGCESPRQRPLLSPHNESLSHLPSPLSSPPSPHRFAVLPIFVVSLISISHKSADPAGYGHSPSTKAWFYLYLRHYGVPHSFMARPHFVPFLVHI